ncbi:MAG TPA: hypothetical protein VFA21_19355 [Pyrinomonadaceae bacterium]|jgi:hypothetical protein|nr:hypothetical protein [Pyrinomonadaceae bacterium]
MKKNLFAMLMSLALLGVFVLPASAAASPQNTSGIDRREMRQQRRIRRGYRRGGLTRSEAMRLERREHRLRRAEMRDRRDGRVTRRERRHLNRRLNRLNRDIRRERHDSERRSQ